ncbi:hypothetical protein AX16_008479 [Volvariella volvacea WC 439]|nr:hypothetical protein AX16_008479 [Volvariella volvacea WC 439]
MPFRAIQPLVDLLTRVAPHKARPLNERIQADEVYKAGHTMRLPVPREASPEPNLNQSADLAQPCPNCVPGNPWGWSCPQPIPDPTTDPEHAWHLDNGAPPGHAHCGNCENLLALQAPTTSKCDFCQVYFCGISVPGRCAAAPLLSQQPHNMNEMIDIIQSTDVYDCFNGNAVEVDFMLDYLRAQQLTPKHIYREVVMHTQSQPRGFSPLIEMDIFADIHNVSGGTDPDPEAPRNRICRVCATEVLLWGLKDWWIRERQKGFVSVHITSRRDCPEGSGCQRQKDADHANEFNHIIAFLPGLPPLPPSNEGPSAVDTPLEADNNSGGTDTQPATPHPVFAHDFSPIPPLSLSGIVPDVPPPYGVPPQIARVSSTTEVANLLNNLSQ